MSYFKYILFERFRDFRAGRIRFTQPGAFNDPFEMPAFKAKEAKSIRVIHLVHPVGNGFGRVEKIDRGENGTHITLTGSQGRTARVPVDWAFLHG